MTTNTLNKILKEVRSCSHCIADLPNGVRPVLQASANAKILIAGQAPGAKVHASGIPFDDASGKRLREWMGVDKTSFYDANKIAILPMGFCYPGTGKSGDLAPRRECADLWRADILALMPNIQLTLIIGQYALHWHLPKMKKLTLTNTVKQWRHFLPHQLPLPHPSPRNNIWLSKNPWFETDVIPELQRRINSVLNKPD